MAFIPGEYQKGIHTVDFLIWHIHQARFIAPLPVGATSGRDF
ncbi:MAG: hypothetical protein OXM61_07680 [Candidatus Poribacteria bacterium]|nr:hypothetical protein [Candidatus Poribacteria bacterium]